MPKTKRSTYDHKQFRDASWGVCGFELDFYLSNKYSNAPVILLKGGLGDAGSHSVKPLARAVIEESKGDVSIATVGTVRPFNLLESLKLFSVQAERNRARDQRELSMVRAGKKALELTRSKRLVFAGQSEGGVSAVDACVAWSQNPDRNKKQKLAVLTIDTPGVYKQMEYEGFPFMDLINLGLHCLPDLAKLSCKQKRALTLDYLKNPRLLLEGPYMLSEINYLKSVGLMTEIEFLRSNNVPVSHVFHGQDIVEGASAALLDPQAMVFDGSHTRFMTEPAPVADALIAVATMPLGENLQQKMINDMGYSYARAA